MISGDTLRLLRTNKVMEISLKMCDVKLTDISSEREYLRVKLMSLK